MRTAPDDLHEWVSFADPDEDRTWVFDVTFLTSGWTCIFGRGCQGVLTGPAPELEHGCCDYGAHFTGDDDRERVERHVARLTASQWQFKKLAGRRGGPIRQQKSGEYVTRLVANACIFLNRPGFEGGAGCALHRAALEGGGHPLDWKPDVCWQLPLRRVDDTDAHGHVTSTVREWKRRDWGPGGAEFHWWCTESHEAFVDSRPVYETMADELRQMVGDTPYALLVEHLRSRTEAHAAGSNGAFLPHPAVRSRPKTPNLRP
ncbi:MAG: hypothetical protein ACRD29_18510 [Acidimicrobiales bacterium]